jgi:hypothetical protein
MFFHKEACCGPGVWNLQFNSLMELNFMERTKVVAYADDLLIATKRDSVRTVKKYAKVELGKMDDWSTKIKIKFKDKKSKVMIVTSERKRGQSHYTPPTLQTIRTSNADEILGNNAGSEI